MKTLRNLIISIGVITSLFLVSTFLLWNFNIYTPLQGANKVFAKDRDIIDQMKSDDLKFNIVVGEDTHELNISDFAKVTYGISKPKYLSYVTGKNPKLINYYSFNDSKLVELLQGFYKKHENAEIKFNKEKGTFKLVEDELNADFDIDKVSKLVEDSIKDQTFTLDINDYLIKPEVTARDLKRAYKDLEWINTWHINYSDGTTITSKDLADCWEDNFLNIEKFDTTAILNALEKSYNTSDKKIKFKTHSGNEIEVPYNTYGKHLYRDKETRFIKSTLSEHKSCDDREPETYGYDNFGDDYIEVSISEQHVWHYKSGKLISDSACVTGCTSKGRGTPTGVFYVSEKIPGKNLKGDNYVTWVNRWMRLTNSGVGLHDAYWRGSFGGNIYINGGSHGCINLPKAYAYQIYDEIQTGIPVVIY